MLWLPGWDSIENASRWQDFYFWLGIGFLGLVAASEIISYRYSVRKDELVQIAGAKATREKDIAEELRQAEVAALQAQLSEANKSVSKLQEQQAVRTLSTDQVRSLIQALSPFKGQKIDIASRWGDREAKAFAEQFLPVFDAVGWQHRGVSEAAFNKDPAGIEVAVNKGEADAGRVPKSADVLVRSLISFGLLKGGSVSPGVPTDTIQLRIGQKPEGDR